jgi:tripartite-type tricarboxylate transporter receptor subunit TctC
MYRILLSLSLTLFPAIVLAQAPPAGALPAKPMLIVVPNAPGGGPDLIARLIAPRLSEVARQNVVVDNKSSANGVVGTEYVARAASDGSVMGMGNAGTHAINPTLYKQLSYDTLRDFAAVSELATTSLVMVAHPKVPGNSIRDLIAEAKRVPGKLNIAVAGATGEVAGNALKQMAKIDMKDIPYKGGGPATIAVLSGESDMTLTNWAGVASQVEAGRLKVLGVTGAQRNPQLPNVPTFAENGLPGFEVEVWYGLFVPAKTPAPVVQRLYQEVARIINLPEVKERLVATGHAVVGSTPQQFQAKVKRDVERYRKIILESGMQQQ